MSSLYDIYLESKLHKAERDKLSDSDFGLPKKRQFPIHDREHVIKAIQMFKKCPEEDRKELAHNIKVKAIEFDVKISEKSLVYSYLSDKDKKDLENANLSESTILFNNDERLFLAPLTEALLGKYQPSYPELGLLNVSSDKYKSLTVVNTATGELVGYASKNRQNDILRHIKINDLYTRQGLGSELLEAIDPSKIRLVNKEKRLQKFFKKNGYVVLNETYNQLLMVKGK